MLSAHCMHPDHGLCRLNRSLTTGVRPGSGRPIGMLLAWLAGAYDSDRFPDQPAHMRLSRRIMKDDPLMSYETRVACREAAKADPEMAPVLALERPVGDDEHEEPLVHMYF